MLQDGNAADSQVLLTHSTGESAVPLSELSTQELESVLASFDHKD